MITLGVYLFGVIFLIISGFVFFKIWQAITTGELPGKGSITYRDRSPFSFWFNIGFFALVGIWLILVALTFFGMAPKWWIQVLKSMNSHGSH